MSENQRSTGDEMESGLNTGADLAGQAIKQGLPTRPNKGGNSGNSPGSNNAGPTNAPSQSNAPPDSSSPDGGGNQSPSAPDDINPPSEGNGPPGGDSNMPDGGSGGSDSLGGSEGGVGSGNGPNGADGNSDGSGTGSSSSNSNTGQNNNGNTGNSNEPPESNPGSGSGAEPSGASGASGAESGAAGSGAVAEAGSGAGAAGSSATGAGAEAGAGAAASGGGAAAGGAASGGAAAAGGAAAGAGGGAAAGATVGTAAGPVGTVVGAVAGALIVPVLKFIGMAIATIFIFISFFMMHPSFLYDNSSATSDRTILENTYNYYYSHIQSEYKKDIESQMRKARVTTTTISFLPLWYANNGDLSKLWEAPSGYPYVSISDEDKDKIWDVTTDEEYDEVEFTSSTAFLYSSEQYLENASSNINLVMSMIDVQKKHWFISLFEEVADSITGGLYSRFTDWIGKKWEGFWNDFIIYDLFSITVGEVTVETRTRLVDVLNGIIDLITGVEGTDEEEEEYLVAIIDIVYTYDLKDLGVGYYAEKLDLDPEEIDRATEMAHYLGDLFGSHAENYFGWYVQGGYHTDAIQGGGVGVNIASALEKFADEVSGMSFDPATSPQRFPISGYTNPPMSCPYGPRNFPADPWHTGIDFAAGGGTPLHPIADGVVLFIAQMPNGFGNYIAVYHGDDDSGRPVTTMYAHMSSFGTFRAGDRVSSSDVIGYVGRTGLSTGNHLHFEVHIGGSRYNPVEVLEVFEYLRP